MAHQLPPESRRLVLPKRFARCFATRSFGTLQAHSCLCSRQMPSRHPQVRQREQRDDLRRVPS